MNLVIFCMELSIETLISLLAGMPSILLFDKVLGPANLWQQLLPHVAELAFNLRIKLIDIYIPFCESRPFC